MKDLLFNELVNIYEKLENTSKRIEKTFIISEFLKELSDEDLKITVLLLQGRVFPHWETKELGISSKILVKALSKLYTVEESKIEQEWSQHGDLGLVAEKLYSQKSQESLFKSNLTVKGVYTTIIKLSDYSGSGSQTFKINSLLKLFINSDKNEIKYLSRLILGDLRIGVGDSILRDSIINAFLPKVFGDPNDTNCFLICPNCNKIVPTGKQCVNCQYSFEKNTQKNTQANNDEKTITSLLEEHKQTYIIINEKIETQKDLEEILKNIENQNKKINKKDNNQDNKKRNTENTKQDSKKDIKIKTDQTNKTITPITSTTIMNPDFIIAKKELRTKISNLISEITQDAFDIINDFSLLVNISKKESLFGLLKITLEPLKPTKVMLFLKAENLQDALNKLKPPVAVEYKYDGFRLQIHKKNNQIKLFTRRFEEVTKQFPDVVDYIKKNVLGENFIIDSEVVGYTYSKTNSKTQLKKLTSLISLKYVPFQKISQRIKRKYDIQRLVKELPVEVNAFDLLYLNNETLIKEPFKKRREILEKIIKEEKGKIVLAKQLIVKDIKEADEFYKESLSKGNEGIMVKSLEGIYKPGKRVGYGLKVKPIMETLDLVIVGAEYGQGKRAGWLTSYYVACQDEDGNLKEIGKVSSGLKELEEQGLTYKELTHLLKDSIISQKGLYVKVKPKIILEIAYEEIQASNAYSSGYALRFPRIIRLREDKDINEISDINTIIDLYKKQRVRDK